MTVKTKPKVISFATSREDAELIWDIARRAVETARKVLMRSRGRIDGDLVNAQLWAMDITAVHCNGRPLRLRELYLADDFNFSHDVFGIHRHLDRETGELGWCFVPRFAVPERG